MNIICETEFEQLGTLHKNGYPYIKNIDDWLHLRKILLDKSAKRNPDHFDESLAAYTPGETLCLLQNPVIQDWFKKIENFQIPQDIEAVILVPCAASKPWIHHKNVQKSLLYKAYNKIIDDVSKKNMPNVYFLTISEPLGIVPQDHWHDFPKYDNPGLFQDDFLRTGFVKTDWLKTPFQTKHMLPFDTFSYQACIEQLSTVIAKVLLPIDKPIISFVDAHEHTTHGHMLNMVQDKNNIMIERHFKKGQARTSPYDFIKETIEKDLKIKKSFKF